MDKPSYRTILRSSDLAVRVSGKTQAEVLTNSAFALFDLMTDLNKVEVQESLPLEVEGVDDELMANWMRELLYFFQGSGYILKEFEISETKGPSVRAEVRGEKFDPDRHEIQREIRSVVAHQCRMGKTGDQWTGQATFEL
ncbi:MAG: archease [Candidatus Binatia bacterium]